jgi:hypothetical protein
MQSLLTHLLFTMQVDKNIYHSKFDSMIPWRHDSLREGDLDLGRDLDFEGKVHAFDVVLGDVFLRVTVRLQEQDDIQYNVSFLFQLYVATDKY